MKEWILRAGLVVLVLLGWRLISWFNSEPILSEAGHKVVQSLQKPENWHIEKDGIINNNLMIIYSLWTSDIYVRDGGDKWRRVGQPFTISDLYAINKETWRVRRHLSDKTVLDQVDALDKPQFVECNPGD
jgi:hypothetical protein